MDASHVVNQELQIPYEYMTAHSRPERVKCIVHISWLRSILTAGELSQFVKHDKLSAAEVCAWLKQGENFGPLWQKLLITVIDKPNKTVIPLPRARSGAKPDVQLTFSQTCSYVAQTNYKNIWKEAYKKYSNSSFNGKLQDRQCKINLIDCGEVLREVISRAYGCPIIALNSSVTAEQLEPNSGFEPHPNLLPALITLETDRNFLIIQELEYEHSLLDCVRFSPAVLSGGYSKPLFIIYQLLRLMRQLHDNGLVLGDITLSDILISDNLWIQVMPRLSANIYNAPSATTTADQLGGKDDQLTQQRTPDDSSQLTESQTLSDNQLLGGDNQLLDGDNQLTAGEQWRRGELGKLCEAWARGQISNFDYLTALNKLAGRRYGDPRSHHVFPWVTDFTSRSGANWRDLTRSKFRLNKGDRQLDLTYDLPPNASANQVPHHVSDVLSEITYYVYLCRVTPKAVLQKYVRPQWVPAEYPSSIQRLQQWTPDECIPEFFTDPTVFK
ncbi:WD repeat-containing protein 81-like, partial [Nilaparvata lugens]|uniref:WD repeat-containing protein 81-like n=1 Tax=Nilaparvata lugens TaxID=108931 RepID=UPI00193DEA07